MDRGALKAVLARERPPPAAAGCACVALSALLAGCATPPRYAWGSYEEQIYVSYAKPGVLTPQMQADQLEKDREQARAANHKLPPGWHMHLAHVYFELGRADLAAQELAAEKSAFPESTVLADRLLANMTGRGAGGAAVPGAGAK